MRTLVVSAVALLVTSVPVSAFAASPTTSDSSLAIHATSKKKETASFPEIGNATRGKKGLTFKVKVAKSERKCEIKVTWKNDTSTYDDATAGSDKICLLSLDVPDSSAVVGEAKATVTVRDSGGKKVATA